MKLTTDEQLLKEAILDILDSGPAFRPIWEFYEDHGPEGAQTEDGANCDRLEFVDEVIKRIRSAKTVDGVLERIRKATPETMNVPGVGEVLTKKGFEEVAHRLYDSGQLLTPADAILGQRRVTYPRAELAQASTRIQELAEHGPIASEVIAILAHRQAARAWHLVKVLLGDCGDPIALLLGVASVDQQARRALDLAADCTAWANEATKQAQAHAAAFDATVAALTAVTFKDARQACAAHQRAAAAYCKALEVSGALLRLEELGLVIKEAV